MPVSTPLLPWICTPGLGRLMGYVDLDVLGNYKLRRLLVEDCLSIVFLPS